MADSDFKQITSDYKETEKYSGYVTSGPSYIRGLYCDIWIPNYSLDSSFDISSDQEKGTLYMKDEKKEVAFTWCGYLSRNYDGKLFLYKISDNVKVSGTVKFTGSDIIDINQFMVENDNLTGGTWPKFLYVYVK